MDTSSPDEPDVAREPIPIKHLKKFLADLQNLTSQLVDPGVPGVLHHMIEEPLGSDSGFAVSYIPSSSQPHMAIGGSLHHYYFRTGSSFCKMPARMIADLHARKQKPKLVIEWHVADIRADEQGETLADIAIGVRNVGLALALYPLVEVHTCGRHGFSFHNDRGQPSRGVDAMPGFDSATSLFEPSAVLYPDRYVPLGTVTGARLGRDLEWPDTSNARSIKFTCNLYADGFFDRQEVEVPGALIKKMFTAKDRGNPQWRTVSE